MHHTAEGMVSFGTPSWIPLSIVALRSNMDEQRIPEPASMQFSAGLAQHMWNAYVHITFRCCSSKGNRTKQDEYYKIRRTYDLCQARSGDLECVRLT